MKPEQELSVEKLTPEKSYVPEPAQLFPDGLLAAIEFLILTVPSLRMPPPEAALLFDRVLFVIVKVSLNV
jgi:hypothetical protein